MKAISIKQPWASMIAQGKKTIETRTWATKYRGELLIVSSKSPKTDGLPTGQALAVARLVACRPMTRADQKKACCHLYPRAWAWELSDIRPIKPFPVRGRLRLFDIAYPQINL